MVYSAPGGLADNGEVEDYQWSAPTPTAVRLTALTGNGAPVWAGLLVLGLAAIVVSDTWRRGRTR